MWKAEVDQTHGHEGMYKPYNMSQYKNLQKGMKERLGGLGPNTGNEEWI